MIPIYRIRPRWIAPLWRLFNIGAGVMPRYLVFGEPTVYVRRREILDAFEAFERKPELISYMHHSPQSRFSRHGRLWLHEKTHWRQLTGFHYGIAYICDHIKQRTEWYGWRLWRRDWWLGKRTPLEREAYESETIA